MNAYLITASNADGSKAKWAASQTEAAAARKSFTDEGFKRAELQTHSVNVPTSKHELIAFLNVVVSSPSAAVLHTMITGA